MSTQRTPGLIAYARISDLTGRRHPDMLTKGVSNQHRTCERIAHGLGITIIKAYTDNGRSASRDHHRPGFEELLADLYRGVTTRGDAIGGVVTVDEDRLYRNQAQRERFVTAFRSAAGRLFATDAGPCDLYAEDTDDHVAIALSLSEGRKHSARTRRWHQGQAQRGMAHTGGKPFGYRPVDGTPGLIEPVPEEAALIRRAVEACLTGASWGQVTEIFQASGLPTRRGGPWRIQTVKQIISSPRLAGLRLLDGDLVRDPAGQPILGRWQAIISPAEWEGVCLRYRPRDRLPGGNSRNPQPRPERKYLLTGTLRCGRDIQGEHCGTLLTACATNRGRSRYRYACRPRGDGGCAGSGVSGEWIDAEIGALVLDRLAVSPSPPCPLWPGQVEMEATRVRLAGLEHRWQHGRVDDDTFYRNSEALNQILDRLQAARAAWAAEHTVRSDTPAERTARWTRSMAEGGYELAQRRAAIFSVLESVLVYPVGRGTQSRGKDSYRAVFRSASNIRAQ